MNFFWRKHASCVNCFCIYWLHTFGWSENLFPPPVEAERFVSRPLVPITVPKATQTRAKNGAKTASIQLDAAAVPRQVDMKLLVITVDGTEPSFQAITTFLQQIGVPYQTVLAKTQGNAR